MSTAHKPSSTPRTRRTGASYRHGYRDVRKKLPDGTVDWVRVPLTLEDVLHPRLGDVHVLTSAHNRDCRYLDTVLNAWLAEDPVALVLADVGVFWDDPRLKHHSPDISVIFGVRRRQDWDSFHVKKEKVRPSLIVEVTSRATRVNDVKTTVEQYAQAGVPFYVIADGPGRGERRRLKLISYQLDNARYKLRQPDDQGRVWLEPVGLWLGVTLDPDTGGDRLVLIDPKTGDAIGDYTAISRELEAEAEKRAEAERLLASEAAARAQAEDRIRELKAELRRLRGRTLP